MSNNNIIKDLTSFTHSKFGHGTTEVLRDMVNGRGGFKNSLTPYILEETELRGTTLDIFSRLLKDRIIFFGEEFNAATCNIAVSQLLYLEQVDPEAEIKIYINSGGGSVYDGLAVIDTIDMISCPVSTTVVGLAASMASILLVSGDIGRRKALRRSRTLIHQPMGGVAPHSQASDIEIVAEQILKLKDELYQIIVDRTKMSMEEVIKAADRDYWMTSDEALKLGFVDEVITKTKK